MKKFVIAVAGLVALAAPALAADLPMKAPPPVMDSGWAGFYLGVNGGYGWGNDTGSQVDFLVAGVDNFRSSNTLATRGGFGGGQAGYNFQRDHVVFGVEVDVQGAGIRNSVSTFIPATNLVALTYNQSMNVDWFGTVRGRLGYAFGPTLLYATGGFAFGGVNYQSNILAVNGAFSNEGNNSSLHAGYVAGAGLEYAFSPSWSVKAEYQYIYFGHEQLVGQVFNANGTIAAGQFTKSSAREDFSTVRVGVNYHLGGPVVAKY
jgi:outer membrane immunogenic protein